MIPRGLPPTGWHVPSDAEWDTLSTHLKNHAGGKLKDTGTIEAGTGLWYAPNAHATNKSGFTALPGGIRAGNSTFYDVGYLGYWWSSTQKGSYGAWFRDLINDNGGIYRYSDDWHYGFSVRCLRD